MGAKVDNVQSFADRAAKLRSRERRLDQQLEMVHLSSFGIDGIVCRQGRFTASYHVWKPAGDTSADLKVKVTR